MLEKTSHFSQGLLYHWPLATGPKASRTCLLPILPHPNIKPVSFSTFIPLYFFQLLHSQSLSPNPSPISIIPSGATISDNECFNIFFSIVFFHYQLKPTFSQRCVFSDFRLWWRLPFLSHALRQQAGVGVRIHPAPWCCTNPNKAYATWGYHFLSPTNTEDLDVCCRHLLTMPNPDLVLRCLSLSVDDHPIH